jgi:DNA-binding NarL/FixJ family response regulator
MNKPNHKIAVIHSDANFGEILCSLVETSDSFSLTGRYENCIDALQSIERDAPDIIVMGLDSPPANGNGVDAIPKFRKLFPGVNVLVIADCKAGEIVFGALNAGANGCILRDSMSNGFIRHLHELVQGGVPISPSIARTIVESMRTTRLTNREIQVLNLITHGNSYTQIACELKISKETSKTHIRNIYRKLNVSKKSEAVRKAFDDKIVPMTWNVDDSLRSLLTLREMEVLNLIVQGNSYSQVALRLKISNDTSKIHIRNIYRKLNVKTKSEVVKKAFGEGIVTMNLNMKESSRNLPMIPYASQSIEALA